MKKYDPKPDAMTLREIDRQIAERTDNIEKEFRGGFDFIKNCDRSVTIFGSARTEEDDPDYKKAYSLGKKISQELDYSIITGGGPGIMEAGNRGSFENGGGSLGLTIKLPFEQVINPYMSSYYDFHYFFARKTCMTFAAEAYVYFPGGFGTLDELFEVLTIVQTQKTERRPIILVGEEFWKPLDAFIREHLLDKAKISPEDIDLYTITDDEDEIIEIIRKAKVYQTTDE